MNNTFTMDILRSHVTHWPLRHREPRDAEQPVLMGTNGTISRTRMNADMKLLKWQRELLDKIGAKIKEVIEEAIRSNDALMTPMLLRNAEALSAEQYRLYEQFAKAA